MNMDNYLNYNRDLIEHLAKIKYDKFKSYQIAGIFCQPDCQLMSKSGKPLYFDSNHMTLTGSEMMRGIFDRLLADLS